MGDVSPAVFLEIVARSKARLESVRLPPALMSQSEREALAVRVLSDVVVSKEYFHATKARKVELREGVQNQKLQRFFI